VSLKGRSGLIYLPISVLPRVPPSFTSDGAKEGPADLPPPPFPIHSKPKLGFTPSHPLDSRDPTCSDTEAGQRPAWVAGRGGGRSRMRGRLSGDPGAWASKLRALRGWGLAPDGCHTTGCVGGHRSLFGQMGDFGEWGWRETCRLSQQHPLSWLQLAPTHATSSSSSSLGSLAGCHTPGAGITDACHRSHGP
jgi:hypothetical protein